MPLISVCIPVYNTEPYLLQCLRSVITQSFADFEIIVVSDSSRGKDGRGRSAKKIVRLAQKECNAFRKQNKLSKLKIHFVEHRENRGILEVRRTLCYEAHGQYICFVDSDDELESGALNLLTGPFDPFDRLRDRDEKIEPPSGLSRICICPFMRITKFLQIASPKPVPPYLRVVEASVW